MSLKVRHDTDDSKLGLDHISGRVSKTKYRLRPWLQALIDSQEIPGLCWLDKERAKFKIPWKHGGKQDWSPESGRIFMEWAKNTGKYREGVDTPRYACWKTRLRCAFNKAPDIVELVSERQPLEPEPYRVYQFRPVRAVQSSRSHHVTSSSQSRFAATASSSSQVSPDGASALPTVLAQYEQSLRVSDEDVPAELLNLIDCDTDTPQSAGGVYISAQLDHNILLLPTLTDSGTPAVTLASPQHVHTYLPRTLSCLEVTVYYCGHTVVSRLTGPVCHFQYTHATTDDTHQIPDDIHKLLMDSELVELPPVITDSVQDEKIVTQLLSSALCHAMYIYATNGGDIYAYRLCRCAVYHTSELMTSGQPVKVPLHGNSLTKIFSYADSFMPALSKYVSGDGVRPDAHVHLLCGQAVSVDKMDNRLLVRVSVRLERAVNDLDAADTALAKLKSGTVIPCVNSQYNVSTYNNLASHCSA